MSANHLKRIAAEAAVDYIRSGDIIGVGTGSTVDYFIAALARIRSRIDGAVASSEHSRQKLQAAGVPLVDLNSVAPLPLYIDGADQANQLMYLIKGGGGALTREKIIAEASDHFLCIIDEAKLAEPFGTFPLPIEVIPMARSLVARALSKLGGTPTWRENFITDNGNEIIDVSGLDMSDPLAVETQINQLPGVVAVGLFVRRAADELLVGTANGVQSLLAQRAQ